MILIRTTPALLVAVGLLQLSACDSHVDVHTDGGRMTFDGNDLLLAGKDSVKARITPDGSLSIGANPVAVSAEQRAELVRVQQSAHLIIRHGIDTGKAGVKVGAAAAGAALEGIAKGDTTDIEAKVEASVKTVREAAGRLCEDLAAMRAAEQAVAATLPAFSPYVTVSDGDVADCRKDVAKDK